MLADMMRRQHVARCAVSTATSSAAAASPGLDHWGNNRVGLRRWLRPLHVPHHDDARHVLDLRHQTFLANHDNRSRSHVALSVIDLRARCAGVLTSTIAAAWCITRPDADVATA